MADKVKTVPLSDNMVKDRIDKMAGDCQNQLHEKLRKTDLAIKPDERKMCQVSLFSLFMCSTLMAMICNKTFFHQQI